MCGDDNLTCNLPGKRTPPVGLVPPGVDPVVEVLGEDDGGAASVSRTSKTHKPAKTDSDGQVPLNYAQYRGTAGPCVAKQQFPGLLGKLMLAPRVY